MTLQYIVNNIIKNNDDKYLDFDIFKEELNIQNYAEIDYEKNTKLRGYHIANHWCTDSVVGWKAYYLDDEFVCLTVKSGRKCDENFLGWVSKEFAQKTKEYITQLFVDNEKEFEVDSIDLNEELGNGYPIGFASQLIGNKVIYKDKIYEVVKKRYDYNDNIEIIDGDTILSVPITDILTPFNIKENT